MIIFTFDIIMVSVAALYLIGYYYSQIKEIMATVYKSKIGWEIIALLGAAMIPALITMLSDLNTQGEDIAIMLTITGFVVALLFTIRYSIDGNMLKIRALFIPYRPIDIYTITKIEETFNPLSAPAASIDRLGITHGGGYMLISPKNRTEFIAQLQSINPSIQFIPRNRK